MLLRGNFSFSTFELLFYFPFSSLKPSHVHSPPVIPSALVALSLAWSEMIEKRNKTQRKFFVNIFLIF